MMALYEYLDPGVNGINIKYWLSSQDDSQKAAGGNSVKQGRPKTLKPSEEFFLKFILHTCLKFLSLL